MRNKGISFLSSSFEFIKRKKFVILGYTSAIITGGYFSYYIYNSEYISRKSREVQDFIASISKISDAIAAGSQVTTTIANDLQKFLESDSDEVPRSIRQLLKLSRGQEFQQALSRITGSVTLGIYRGVTAEGDFLDVDIKGKADTYGRSYQPKNGLTDHSQPSGFSSQELFDKVFDKLFSDAGRGFVSVIVSRGVRSLVNTYLDHSDRSQRHSDKDKSRESSPGPSFSPEVSSGWQETCLQLACSERGRALLTDCITAFTVSAVSTYVEKTKDVNMYDDILSSVVRPENREPVKDLITTVCTGAVDTLVKASHEVLTLDSQQQMHQDFGARYIESVDSSTLRIGNAITEPSSGIDTEAPGSHVRQSLDRKMSSVLSSDEFGDESESTPIHYARGRGTTVTAHYGSLSAEKPGWISTVKQLCLVPEFRQLFLSVVGTMSAQSTRALIFAGMDAIKSKRRNGSAEDSVQDDGVPESGMSGVRNSSFLNSQTLHRIAFRAMTAASVCVALCLHGVTLFPIGYHLKGN